MQAAERYALEIADTFNPNFPSTLSTKVFHHVKTTLRVFFHRCFRALHNP